MNCKSMERKKKYSSGLGLRFTNKCPDCAITEKGILLIRSIELGTSLARTMKNDNFLKKRKAAVGWKVVEPKMATVNITFFFVNNSCS